MPNRVILRNWLMFVGAGKSVTHRVGQEAEAQPGVMAAVLGSFLFPCTL